MGEVAKTATRAAAAVSTGGLSEVERAAGGNNSLFRGLENSAGQAGSDFMGDLTGAKAADAAGRAAMAQAEEARNSRTAIMGMHGRLESSAMDLAKMSPDEMRAFSASLDAGHRQLMSDQKLLDAVDPTLMEASSKILSLLRQDNSYSKPTRSMDALYAARDQQRQQLIDRLRNQLGPGAETSSVGLKALRDFDLASSSDLAKQSMNFDMGDQQMQMNAQGMRLNEMQSLGQLMGMQAQIRPDLMRAGTNLTNLSGVFRNRELNTKMNVGGMGLSALAGANAPVIQSAGAQYVGDQMRAQGMQSLYGNLLNGGMMIAGKAMTGGAAGK